MIWPPSRSSRLENSTPYSGARFHSSTPASSAITSASAAAPATFLGGQGAGVLVGLIVGAQHGLVPARAVERAAGLLGLADEAAAAVEVDEAVVGAAVGLADDDAALEHVGVVAGVVPRRVGARQTEDLAQLGEEELVVGALAAAGALPAGDEGVEGGGVGGGGSCGDGRGGGG